MDKIEQKIRIFTHK